MNLINNESIMIDPEDVCMKKKQSCQIFVVSTHFSGCKFNRCNDSFSLMKFYFSKMPLNRAELFKQVYFNSKALTYDNGFSQTIFSTLYPATSLNFPG